MTEKFDKYEPPFIAYVYLTEKKSLEEPTIVVHDTRTITYDAASRTYILKGSNGDARCEAIKSDELRRITLLRKQTD